MVNRGYCVCSIVWDSQRRYLIKKQYKQKSEGNEVGLNGNLSIVVIWQRESQEQRLQYEVVFSFLQKKQLGQKKIVTIAESQHLLWMVLKFELWFAERCRKYREDLARSQERVFQAKPSPLGEHVLGVSGTAKKLMKLEHRDLGKEWQEMRPRR